MAVVPFDQQMPGHMILKLVSGFESKAGAEWTRVVPGSGMPQKVFLENPAAPALFVTQLTRKDLTTVRVIGGALAPKALGADEAE